MKVLKPVLMGDTKKNSLYYTVRLCKNDGTIKNYRVHRLVALHFIVNPRLLNMVDHIDGNKYNNKASNLRWCTNKENLNNPNSNVVKPVARFTLEGEYLDERPSIMSYETEFGFKHSNIAACLSGRTKSAYGFKWQYLDKDGYLENF